MENEKIYAVLTGDIIKSGSLSPEQLKSVRGVLADAPNQLEKSLNKKIFPGEMDFYRGDGWQLLLCEPCMSLRVSLFLRASLLAHELNDTRISVGIGTAKSIDSQKVSKSIGDAFTYSGTGLDRLNKRNYMTISGLLTEKKLEISVFELADAIVQGWTSRQAQAVQQALKGFHTNTIAVKIDPPASRQTAYKLLTEARWQALREAINRYEKA